MARRFTAPYLEQIAAKYAPRGITIRYRRDRKLTPAHARLDMCEMFIPRPVTRQALYINLHESAHFHLKHFDPEDAQNDDLRDAYTGNHLLAKGHEEYEAEQWTIATMRREGVPVPRSMLRAAKAYVRHLQSQPSAKPVPAHVKRFAKR